MRLVNFYGRLLPESLIEDVWQYAPQGACPECGGLGAIPEQIDEDRWPEMVPCHRCRNAEKNAEEK